MSLINYVQPVDVGSILTGIANIALACFLMIVIYKLYIFMLSFIEDKATLSRKKTLLKTFMLNEVAKDKGIDLEEELMKIEIIEKPTFQQKIEEEMFEKMFGKDKKN